MNESMSTAENKKAIRELETTYDILQATLPSIKSPEQDSDRVTISLTPVHTPVGQKVPSPYACSSEDEVYFGPTTDKEANGKNSR